MSDRNKQYNLCLHHCGLSVSKSVDILMNIMRHSDLLIISQFTSGHKNDLLAPWFQFKRCMCLCEKKRERDRDRDWEDHCSSNLVIQLLTVPLCFFRTSLTTYKTTTWRRQFNIGTWASALLITHVLISGSQHRAWAVAKQTGAFLLKHVLNLR